MVIATASAHSDDHSYHLLLLVLWLIVEQANGLRLTLVVRWNYVLRYLAAVYLLLLIAIFRH